MSSAIYDLRPCAVCKEALGHPEEFEQIGQFEVHSKPACLLPAKARIHTRELLSALAKRVRQKFGTS